MYPDDSQRSDCLNERRSLLPAMGLLLLAGILVYLNAFSVPFLFDDQESVVENPTIRRLWPVWAPLAPPRAAALTVSGRPVVNLTLALNYAVSGTGVVSYHAVNLLIHLLAGLTLFGVLRRTWRRTRLATAATPLAFTVALLWLLHPLQTEAVTYVVQRAESLVGLFYLLTLYAFIRSVDEAGRPATGWQVLAVVACLLGMASKEVMVSAPLAVLAYDRTFVAGTWREAWRRRWGLYLALAATWLVLAWLVAGTASRGGSVGLAEITAWEYALTQCRAIMHYLRLVLWPHPLVFDYGYDVTRHLNAVGFQAVALVLLLAATVAAWRWRPALGFVATCFFALLAPSSSVVPVATQTMAEHRMYLPLAAVLVLAVLGLHALLGRKGLILSVVLALVLGGVTVERNRDYASALGIWTDTATKLPSNPRAHFNRGSLLLVAGQFQEAAAAFERSLELEPRDAEALNDLGRALTGLGRLPEAVTRFEQALQLAPSADAEDNLGGVLASLGRTNEALVHFARAQQLEPDRAGTAFNAGLALARAGRIAEAVGHFAEAVRLQPDYADAHLALAQALAETGRTQEAMTHQAEGRRLKALHP